MNRRKLFSPTHNTNFLIGTERLSNIPPNMVEHFLFVKPFVSLVDGLCDHASSKKTSMRIQHYRAVKARRVFARHQVRPGSAIPLFPVDKKKEPKLAVVKWNGDTKKSLSVHVKLTSGVREAIRQERRCWNCSTTLALRQAKCQSKGIFQLLFSNPIGNETSTVERSC